MAPHSTHSALEPAGIQAARVLALFHEYLDVSVLVFVLVIGALGFALSRKEVGDSTQHQSLPDRTRRRVVAWATVATTFVLVGLLVASVVTTRALASLPKADTVRVQVVAHKWWWEFRYPVSGPATQFTTAYELHIPVGRPVALELIASDVIHSFWVPALSGKRDAIPGRDTTLILRADEAGAYEGQCAEFCGAAHAHMRFSVVAESPEQFAAWKAHQLGSPAPPSDPLRQRGLALFMNSRCPACHSVGGTEAFGKIGPDLTHIASRSRLAMGTLPNDASHLTSWVLDPQRSKPGVPMPSTPLGKDDLHALRAYLGGLL
jgi:cytochrome c oxidase subunit 2